MTSSIYPKPIRLLMKDEMAPALAGQPGQSFSRKQAVGWFALHYPRIKSSAVQAHLIRLSTNAPVRVHYNPKPNEDDVFFKLGASHFRPYDPAQDPAPLRDTTTETAEVRARTGQARLDDRGGGVEDTVVGSKKEPIETDNETDFPGHRCEQLEAFLTKLRSAEDQAMAEVLAFMSYNPSIGRVLEKRGVGKFRKLMVGIVQKLPAVQSRSDFDQLHRECVSTLLNDRARFSCAPIAN
jgi:hypothetical protein